MNTKKTKWTDEVIQFMIDNYKGKDNIELAKLLNDKFNLDTNNDRVSNVKANLKRRKGIDLTTNINRGKYRKGIPPANKGKKQIEFMTKEGIERSKPTRFKKGNIPYNRREIGDERISKDGYIEIKLRDGCGNKNWEYKHRHIYEQHYGKIPKKTHIIFLDGNKRNLDISNLKAVSNSEELIMNNKKLFSTDKETTNTGTIIAKVIDKTRKVKNERQGKGN